MAGLTWLHLSDWHQKGKDFDRDIVRDALIQDIKERTTRISPDLTRIDFIVFSGDVAHTGRKEEYKAAIEHLFDPVLEASDLNKDKLFIVPGNHDLDRETFKYLFEALKQPLTSDKDVKEWLTDPEGVKNLLRPFQAYSDFVGHINQSQSTYAYLRKFQVGGKDIALIGLNSALLSGRHKENREDKLIVNDDRHLVLGEPQIRDLLRSEDFRQADVQIAVMHHPFEWLIEFDREVVRDRLKKACHFILHGHEHQPSVNVELGPGGNCIIIPAGPCYDRREPKVSRCANAYNYVHLDFTDGKGQVYLRRYDDRQGWIKDTSTTGDESPGLYPFDLPKNLCKEEPESPPQIEEQEPINVPFVIVAMNKQQASELIDETVLKGPKISEDELGRFRAFKEVFSKEVENWLSHYADVPESWRPHTCSESTIYDIIDDAAKMNQSRYSKSAWPLICPKFCSAEFFAEDEDLQEETWRELKASGCVLIIDAISLFHPHIRKTLLDSGMGSKEKVAMLVLLPINHSAHQAQQLLETELHTHMRLAFARFNKHFDKLCEVSGSDLRTLNRWLFAILPETVANAQNMKPNDAMLQQTWSGKEPTDIRRAIFGQGGRQ